GSFWFPRSCPETRSQLSKLLNELCYSLTFQEFSSKTGAMWFPSRLFDGDDDLNPIAMQVFHKLLQFGPTPLKVFRRFPFLREHVQEDVCIAAVGVAIVEKSHPLQAMSLPLRLHSA